jgi:hypothetical protein
MRLRHMDVQWETYEPSAKSGGAYYHRCTLLKFDVLQYEPNRPCEASGYHPIFVSGVWYLCTIMTFGLIFGRVEMRNLRA